MYGQDTNDSLGNLRAVAEALESYLAKQSNLRHPFFTQIASIADHCEELHGEIKEFYEGL